MNLIVCDQRCRHQKEGYCTLNHISNLTADNSGKCGYYSTETGSKGKTTSIRAKRETSAPYYADRL